MSRIIITITQSIILDKSEIIIGNYNIFLNTSL